MQHIYAVPGLLGSALSELVGDHQYLRWISLVSLALGDWVKFGLAPDGEEPLQPDGRVMRAGEPLDDYYGPLIRHLESVEWSTPTTVVAVGYDWRKSIILEGSRLASRIRTDVEASAPCTIIGHSQGGLVARAAWYWLARTDETHLIRRMITVGTPHRGCYAPVKVWVLDEDLLLQMALVCNTVAGYSSGPYVINPPPYITPRSISRVTATFPAFFELLPLLDTEAEANDPFRGRVYDADRWPSVSGVTAQAIADWALPMQAVLLDPSSMPPSEVLTTVAGTGQPTPYAALDVVTWSDAGVCRVYDRGDGRVPVDSALVEMSAQVVIPSGHGELCLQPRLLDMMQALVEDSRGPTPAPQVDLSMGTPLTQGPPVYAGRYWDSDC